MRKINPPLLLLVPLFLAVGCSKKTPDAPKKKPTRVEVAKTRVAKIPILLEAVGHYTPFNTVEIKAQVEGVLEVLHFTEGQKVTEGAPLFTIDPRPFEAKKLQAEAALLENQANLAFAIDKASRYSHLVNENYVSQVNYDEYTTNVEVYNAAVMKNRAEIDLAQINLDYCFIQSPITGFTSKRLVDRGNLIVNDGKPMLTVNQISPIFVDFSLPEKDFFKVLRRQKSRPLKIYTIVPGYEDRPFVGELQMIDNHIKQSTGMIPLRGILPNSDELLWPGQFVRVQVLLDEIPNAVMVPQVAINLGPKGKYVWVVDRQKTVEMRQVETGEELGKEVQIIEGLKEGELVVKNGQLTLRPNDHVKIVAED
ncbi:MAG: Multidrug resistance protein MdtA [Chlamydiia bacterium]|nr:Multidrug resistance protein MdtA [Chlamydiia bacterium]